MKISIATSTSNNTQALTAIGIFESTDADVKKIFHKYGVKAKFAGKAGEGLLVAHTGGRAVYLVGLGKKEAFTLQRVRVATTRVLAQAKTLKLSAVIVELESFAHGQDLGGLAAAVVEGARLSSYSFKKYKSKNAPDEGIETLEILVHDAKKAPGLKKKIAEAEIVSAGVIFARDLANEPPNVMTPSRLADEAKKMASTYGLTCKVLGLSEIKKLKMGGLLGVAQGSAEEPRFIILENKVAKPILSQPIVLVGKGITFDTGGISIKPSGDMDKMKFDMCGAAAVIGTLKAVAELKLPVRVVGLVPTCENMPGGRAQRPGDIIKISNGKTVEVLNTDAEGRLILADALSYAEKFKPKAVVDIATLTGACAVTFADLAIGLMGKDADLVSRIKEAGESCGERCWELPLWDEYYDLIKASYADIQNISKKYAGTITAGMFLKEFTDYTKSWAHLDIAGTAWLDGGAKPLTPIGATGVGVRLFIELIKSYIKK